MTRWARILQAACTFGVAGAACGYLLRLRYDLFVMQSQVAFCLTTMAAAFISAHAVWHVALRKKDAPLAPGAGAVLGVVSTMLALPLMLILGVCLIEAPQTRPVLLVPAEAFPIIFATIPVGGFVGWAVARWQRKNWNPCMPARSNELA